MAASFSIHDAQGEKFRSFRSSKRHDVVRGFQSWTTTQQVPWGLVVNRGWMQAEVGGTLLWIFTTRYSVGP